MGTKAWALALASLVVAGCAAPPDAAGPCGGGYVAGAYSDPGPWTDDGWYYPGDDGSDDGSSNAVDGTSGGGGTSGDDGSGGGASNSDPGAGSGDDSSGSDSGGSSDGSGDDSSGDDGTDAVRHPRLKTLHRRRRDTLGLATAPAPVVAADANGCYSCTLTCVLASAPPGAPNAGTAVGASNVDPDAACGDAQAELRTWAQEQGTSLQACRLGSAPPPEASPPAVSQGAAPASAPPALRGAPPQLFPGTEARFQ
jgi:hypothetical protein